MSLVYALTANMVPLSAKATTIYGDVDNSGSVNLSDAIILSRYIVGNYRTSDVNMKYADVDKKPVFMEYTLGNETYRSAVGIHTQGVNIGSDVYGRGIRITPQVSRFFYSNPNIG